MIAWKFLQRGGLSPFAQSAFPPDGAWAVAHAPLEPCRAGIHVCRLDELSRWLHDELWEVEVAGATMPGVDALLAERARLLRRVDAWNEAMRERLLGAAIDHARAHVAARTDERAAAYVEDAATSIRSTTAGRLHAAALGVAHASGEEARAAYDHERAWQSRWLANALGLVS